MVSEAHKLTYEDYLDMPNDGRRYEIIRGELFVSPTPTFTHQQVLKHLFLLVHEFVSSRNLGTVMFAPLTVRLTPDEPVESDLLYISLERASIIEETGIRGAPDLIAEILSPNNRRRDLVTKFNRYAQVGVKEYWIVDPVARTVDQFRLVGDVYVRSESEPGIIRSHVLAGFEASTNAIFRG